MARATISLDQICGGAVLERFRLGMAQILRNIMDPNTNPEKARTLTIKMTFKADKNRKNMKMQVSTNISLAPPEADETLMLIGQDLRTGAIEMSECGDDSQRIQVAGESIPVKAEVIPTAPPPRAFDPETGEIFEPQNGPIDLRKAI